MATSTLHTLLIKMGFDTSSLGPGINLIRSELDKLQASGTRTAAAFVPATTALTNFAVAADRVAGSLQSPQAMNNMATTVKELSNTLIGSKSAIDQVVSSYAIAMRQIGESTKSGQSLSIFSKAVTDVTAAVGGATPAVRRWLTEMRGLATQFAATDPAKFNLMVQESARHMVQAAGSSEVFRRSLQQLALQQIINNNAAAVMAARQNAVVNSMLMQQAKINMVNQAAAVAYQQQIRAANALGAALGSTIPASSGAATGLNRVAMAANNAAAATQTAANRATFFQRVLSMAFAFSGGVAVTNVISFVGQALVGFNSRLEQAHIAFTNLLGDMNKANDFITQMEEFAAVTPFEFQGLEDDVQKLIAMGFAADEALPVLRAIGDAVAGLGGTADKIDRIAIALGQMKTAGRVNAQDMRQLTEAGIPAWQMLADSIGKTTQETRKLAQAGLLPAGQALAAITSGMEERFGGMMEKQVNTFQGAMSTIHDIAIQTIAGAVQPAFGAVSQLMIGLAQFLIAGGGQYIAPTIWAIGIALTTAAIPALIAGANAAAGFSVALMGISIPLLPLIVAVNVFGLAWQQNWLGIQSVVMPIAQHLGDALMRVASSFSILQPLIEPLAIAIAIRLTASIIQQGAAALFTAVANALLGKSMIGLTVDSSLAAAGVANLTRTTILSRGPIGALIGLIGGAGAAATLGWSVALGLLIAKWDEVMQGLRVVYFGFLQAEKAAGDFFTTLIGGVPILGDLARGLRDHAQSELNATVGAMGDAAKAMSDAADAADVTATAEKIYNQIDTQFQTFLQRIKNEQGDVTNATQGLVDTFGTTLEGVKLAAEYAGSDAMYAMAKAIQDKQDAPIKQLATALDMMTNQLDAHVEVARLYGILTSQQMAAGLASGNSMVVAQFEALRKNILERLDEITDDAWSAGTNAAAAYAKAWQEVMDRGALYMTPDAIDRLATSMVDARKRAFDSWVPSADAVKNALVGVNDELTQMRQNTGALSDLKSAFSDIRRSAEDFFRAQHNAALQAIDDAVKQKNAILDIKMALNSGPVDAAQRALDAQRAQIEEWRLREAIRTASTPEAYRDAVLALQDFLQQQHINQMRSEADAANEVIKRQQQANTDKANAAKEAENRRYEQMQRDFERQLQLLQDYLEKHPGMWQDTEDRVIKLLRGYGFSYKQAASLLGNSFVEGLREQINAAALAAQQMAEASLAAISRTLGGGAVGSSYGSGPGGPAPGSTIVLPGGGAGSSYSGGSSSYGSGPGGPAPFQTGAWEILKDNTLATLHAREMVVRPDVAPYIRALGESRFPSTAGLSSLSTTKTSGPMGGGTIIFQVGDEKLGEISDKALQRQADIYGNRGRVTLRADR